MGYSVKVAHLRTVLGLRVTQLDEGIEFGSERTLYAPLQFITCNYLNFHSKMDESRSQSSDECYREPVNYYTRWLGVSNADTRFLSTS